MKKHQGYLLVTAALIIVIFSLLATSLVQIYIATTTSSSHRQAFNKATALAKAGIETGLYQLIKGALVCDGVWQPTENDATGEFRYKCDYYNAIDALATSISSTSTTLPLVSNVGFASFGSVRINNETIYYSGTSSDSGTCNGSAFCLLNARRGANSSTATSHTIGNSVNQYQYVITSSAGSPNLTAPYGLTELAQALNFSPKYYLVGNSGKILRGSENGFNEQQDVGSTQLQAVTFFAENQGWAVGNSSRIFYFNGIIWSEIYDNGGQLLRTIHCVNENDCWAAGAQGRFHHYNGSNWSFSTNVGTNINGLYCVTSNDCWAVGNSSKIFHYNGSNWSQFVDLGNNALDSVYCTVSNNCWVVGASGKFYFYNGSNWTQQHDSGNNRLHAVYCNAANDCWAVGSRGQIYHYNGANWNLNTDIANLNFTGVSCQSSDDCIAIVDGNHSNAYHYNGSNWAAVSLGSNYRLNAVVKTVTPQLVLGVFNQPVA